MENDLTRFVKNDKFASYIGIKLVKVEPGYALAQLEITENLLNGVGIVHGGATFALADFAFAAASNSSGIITVGINASIAYFKPPKGKIITAEAREISSTKKVCNYSIDVFDENHEIIARMSGTGFRKQ